MLAVDWVPPPELILLLLAGLALSALYVLFITAFAAIRPSVAPKMPPLAPEERVGLWKETVVALVVPLALIVLVLGSILGGMAIGILLEGSFGWDGAFLVGLGAGSLAVYAEPGDTLRYYEINPDVVDFAYRYFTYCEDCKGDLQIALGDARIQMERELAEQEPQAFDVLAIDAFSSDAIPMHLLTQECFAIYFEHLKADGILAVHISNRYLDLEPVVRTLAKQAGYTPLLFDWRPDDDEQDRLYANTWVLVTRNGEFLASPVVQERSSAWPAFAERTLLWTDDYGSLIQVLHRKW